MVGVTLLILGGAVITGLLSKSDKQQVIVADNTNNKQQDFIPDNKQTTKKVIQKPSIKYYYSLQKTNLFKDQSIAYFKTFINDITQGNNNAKYEGEHFLATIPRNTFVGTYTGLQKGNLIQLRSILNKKSYTFWVEKKHVKPFLKYDSSKNKTSGIINQIINNY